MPYCPRCEKNRPVSAFTICRKRKSGLASYCQDCNRAYQREHYRADPTRQKNRSSAYKERVNAWLIKYKESRPCVDCGKKYPYYVMDFDHLDRSTKLENVALLRRRGIHILKEEIAKCELVCANCHRIRTHAPVVQPAERRSRKAETSVRL